MKKARIRKKSKARPLIISLIAIIAVIAVIWILLSLHNTANTTNNAYKAFWQALVEAELSSNIQESLVYAVPHIVIVNNNTVTAIEIGEIVNKTFWDSILSLQAKKSAGVVQIPVYTGQTVIGYVNINESRLNELLKSIVSGSGPHIIMFGLTTCPHCHNMYTFFKQNYAGIFTVYWLDTNKVEY
ncbi:MAG: hypothetical protein QXH86_07680 [Ignisphaera sp.]